MHKISRGATDGSYWFALIHIRYQPTDVTTLKLKIVWVIENFLGTGIGGTKSNIIGGSGVTAHEKVEFKENICVTRQGLQHSRQGGNIWILAQEMP